MKHNKPTFLCTRWRMMDYLVKKGHEPIDTMVDSRNPKYNVWLFENSGEKFQRDVDEWFESIKQFKKQ